jgi:hypothetical protein
VRALRLLAGFHRNRTLEMSDGLEGEEEWRKLL